MMNILSIVFLALILATLGLFFVMVRSLMRELYTFIAPPVDGEEASPIMSLVNEVGKASGKAIALEIKTTAMGKASGQARLEQAIQGDIAQDSLTANNPLVGGLLEMYPTLKKRALKNPGVTEFLLNRLTAQPGVNIPGNGGQSNYGERLSKYKGA
tara:strand:- start:372 stop:839 length:468 start_codon:yes stop_codon:yes gene_type:complete